MAEGRGREAAASLQFHLPVVAAWFPRIAVFRVRRAWPATLLMCALATRRTGPRRKIYSNVRVFPSRALQSPNKTARYLHCAGLAASFFGGTQHPGYAAATPLPRDTPCGCAVRRLFFAEIPS